MHQSQISSDGVIAQSRAQYPPGGGCAWRCAAARGGYEKAARISLTAYREEISLRQAALKPGILTEAQFDDWVRPEETTRPPAG
jgi:hypothetical protein